MKLSNKILIGLLFLIKIESSGQLRPFTNDSTISDIKGKVKTDTTLYWPKELLSTPADPYTANYYSDFLAGADEPVLSNIYLDKEIIRFTWLRSFHHKVIIRIENSNNTIKIFQKEIKTPEPIQIDKNTFRHPRYTEVELSYVKNSVDNFNLSNWESIMRIINNTGYLAMKPTPNMSDLGTDGADWIIELHNKDGWYIVYRWTPTNDNEKNFRKIGDYILDKSKFRRQERY